MPGAADTAVISLAGIAVTYTSGDTKVTALTLNGAHSSLDVQGGTLQVTTGALAISNAFTAIVDGGTLEGQTTFTVSGAAHHREQRYAPGPQ